MGFSRKKIVTPLLRISIENSRGVESKSRWNSRGCTKNWGKNMEFQEGLLKKQSISPTWGGVQFFSGKAHCRWDLLPIHFKICYSILGRPSLVKKKVILQICLSTKISASELCVKYTSSRKTNDSLLFQIKRFWTFLFMFVDSWLCMDYPEGCPKPVGIVIKICCASYWPVTKTSNECGK